MRTKTTATIATQVAALQGLKVPELVAKYREVYGKEPRTQHAQWLRKRIAWKVQEIAAGNHGLSEAAQSRLEELIAEVARDFPALAGGPRKVTGKLSRAGGRPNAPVVGTTLVRAWHGREVRVTVVESGFECDGVVHRTLSAAAKAVTGAHWNGKLFFGLTARKREA